MTTSPNPVAVRLGLRGSPAPAMRLSRKVIIGLSCAGGIAIGGCVMLALQASPAKPAKASAPSPDVGPKPVADQLNALPKDYTQIPRLGPPLPGDLGRPILMTEGALSNAAPGPAASALSAARPGAGDEATGSSASSTARSTDDARKAAAQSPLFATSKVPPLDTATPTGSAPAVASTPPIPFPGVVEAPAADVKPASDKQAAFIDAPSDRVVVSPDRLQPAASPDLLQAGSVIPAALITGIRSDLPGQVTAQVTENVYDTQTGKTLLIPQGARLIGRYDNALAVGQNRVLLAWSRLILPNGRSIVLERVSAADAAGLAGLNDRTDNHWSGVLGASALSTLLSVGSEVGSSNRVNDIVRALRNGISDSMNRTGQQVVERQLNVQPTLTIRPGFPLRVILTRDLVLEPYEN